VRDWSTPGEWVRKKSLKDEVFELLHQRIVAGKYSPGEWLRQEELAQQLGVSQTPVREALDLLVSVGLAERVPYRGCRCQSGRQRRLRCLYHAADPGERRSAHGRAIYFTTQLRSLTETIEQTKGLISWMICPPAQLNKRFHLLSRRRAATS